MQIKLFTIPIYGGEAITEEMNAFLRSKKVLQTEQQLVSNERGACWCFFIKYIDDHAATDSGKKKVDYREVLDEATFQRFSKLREIRKSLATQEGLPAYAIFTDEELAELAKLEVINAATMKSIKGIGEKKVERYGSQFYTKPADEKSKSPTGKSG
ncbi:MAG: HRDC domain-containing protein [Saprospiraceae bacterium]|nr:HRDC domain-containing protein [Saprospiraceae bacterium]